MDTGYQQMEDERLNKLIKNQQAEIDTKIENWEQAEKDLSGSRKKLAKAQAEIDESEGKITKTDWSKIRDKHKGK